MKYNNNATTPNNNNVAKTRNKPGRCGGQRCADMYPRLDILRISAILTDTDRIRIVISLFERIRILCHGYSTDMHYAFILFLKFYFMSIVYTTLDTGSTGTNCKLSSYRVSSYRRITKTNQS